MAATFEHSDKIPAVTTATNGEGFNPADYQEGAPTIQPKTDAEGNAIITAAGGSGLCADLSDAENCPLVIPPLPELQEHGFGPKPPREGSTFSPTSQPKEVGFGPKPIEQGTVFSPTTRPKEIGFGPKILGPTFSPTRGGTQPF
ncbi:MAG: hypothetical protein C0469_13395 [Cyanobacteria bacterium DS2.3.42]|nr:hypothetical protein [Cyanobacteria bacterium DS2.3.42]